MKYTISGQWEREKPIDPEKYKVILNSDGFINDMWNSLDATSKIGALEKLGFDVEVEWDKWSKEKEEFFNKAFLEGKDEDQALEDKDKDEHNRFVRNSEDWMDEHIK